MPARDLYHNELKTALVKDGWTITHDPLRLEWGAKDMYVDLGAERFLGAEKGNRKIAVEGKTFAGPSELSDLERAVGQFMIYEGVLEQTHPDRSLYLAVRRQTKAEFFDEPLGQLVLRKCALRLLVFDADKQEVLEWLP